MKWALLAACGVLISSSALAGGHGHLLSHDAIGQHTATTQLRDLFHPQDHIAPPATWRGSIGEDHIAPPAAWRMGVADDHIAPPAAWRMGADDHIAPPAARRFGVADDHIAPPAAWRTSVADDHIAPPASRTVADATSERLVKPAWTE